MEDARVRMSAQPKSQHGQAVRGLEAGAIPGMGYGRFGRMFAFSGRLLSDACLRAIAKAMIKTDFGKPITSAEPVDENPTIPAGYTYFGQFIDHDLTLDPTPLSAKDADIAALEDFRTPALDLDCIYGRGPDDQPYMYDGPTLRLGATLQPRNVKGQATVQSPRDVLRLAVSDTFQPAILGDKRNDENRIVTQIQAAFIAFHNKVVNDTGIIEAFDGDFSDDLSRFRTAVRITRWHYQWLVVNDFLKRVLSPNTVDEVLPPGGPPRLDAYLKPDQRFAYIPVEFAGAAYRFGHSMVRPSYALNADVGTDAGTATTSGRIPIFSRGPNATDNLNGFGPPIPAHWGIDWAFFLDGVKRTEFAAGVETPAAKFAIPQQSYRIDANLVDPLVDLPEFRSAHLPGETAAPSILANLAYRNLVRGVVNLRLPSGEQVARAFGLEPLTPQQLWTSAGSRLLDPARLGETKSDYDDVIARRKVVFDGFVHNGGELRGATPLWYYILREAEYYGVGRVAEDPKEGEWGGQFLGPVGSRIVAQTFVGLLMGDEKSYLRREPLFQPKAPIADDRPFTLSRLMTWALS